MSTDISAQCYAIPWNPDGTLALDYVTIVGDFCVNAHLPLTLMAVLWW